MAAPFTLLSRYPVGMSAVCPACGVAVVPGYVKCPKCHAALPVTARRGAVTSTSGTTLEERRVPLLPVLVGIGVLATIIAVFALKAGPRSSATAGVPTPATAAATVEAAASTVPTAPASAAPVVVGPDPRAAASALESSLQRQRLWSTVSVTGARVDVRSSACAEPAMGPALAAAAASLKAAGITQLRCLAQAGSVQSERTL